MLENISFVPEVLGVPAAQQRRRAFQVLKWVGLQHRMNAYPHDLSGGEQQRIAIARALVNDPALLLADEPTGNLDPDLSLEIMNLLREINAGGTTVLVATHDRELIRLVGRRTITLDQGRVVEVGMRALDYAFRQGGASLWRSRGSSAFAVLAIALALIVLGALLLRDVERRAAAGAVDIGGGVLGLSARRRDVGAARRDRSRHRSERVSAGPRVRVEGAGADALPAASSPSWRSWPSGFDDNPFPASLEVRVRAERRARWPRGCAGQTARRSCRAWPTCGTTASGWRASAPALETVRAAGFALALLMALAAAVTVATVVRLGLHARRDEIEIMELVGAPLAFIRGPFVAEGLAAGRHRRASGDSVPVGRVPCVADGLVGDRAQRPARRRDPAVPADSPCALPDPRRDGGRQRRAAWWPPRDAGLSACVDRSH